MQVATTQPNDRLAQSCKQTDIFSDSVAGPLNKCENFFILLSFGLKNIKIMVVFIITGKKWFIKFFVSF